MPTQLATSFTSERKSEPLRVDSRLVFAIVLLAVAAGFVAYSVIAGPDLSAIGGDNPTVTMVGP